MATFSGSGSVSIKGSQFNDIRGNYVVYDQKRHINKDSNNVYNHHNTDSFNDNSTRFRGWNTQPPFPHDDEDDNEMDCVPSTSADDQGGEYHPGPPPPQRQFLPPQIPPAGGHISNHDSFNTTNHQISGSFNDCSRTNYDSRAPPTNQRRGVRPQKLQSNSELFDKFTKSTRSQTKSFLPGNGYENDESEDNDSSSSHAIGAKDPMSIESRDKSCCQLTDSDYITSPPSPPISTKFNPQELLKPGINHPMDPSNTSTHSASLDLRHSNPSLTPHMKEQATVNFLSKSTAAHQDEIHGPNTPPTVSHSVPSAPSSPSFPGSSTVIIHGDPTTANRTSVHQTNISTKESNVNSLVDTSDKQKKGTKKLWFLKWFSGRVTLPGKSTRI